MSSDFEDVVFLIILTFPILFMTKSIGPLIAALDILFAPIVAISESLALLISSVFVGAAFIVGNGAETTASSVLVGPISFILSAAGVALGVSTVIEMASKSPTSGPVGPIFPSLPSIELEDDESEEQDPIEGVKAEYVGGEMDELELESEIETELLEQAEDLEPDCDDEGDESSDEDDSVVRRAVPKPDIGGIDRENTGENENE